MHQGELFADHQQDPRNEALMQVINSIHQGQIGRSTSRSVAGRRKKVWMMKREHLSPRINEIPTVKA